MPEQHKAPIAHDPIVITTDVITTDVITTEALLANAPDLAECDDIADAFVAGAKAALVELAALLIQQGIDFRLDLHIVDHDEETH